MSRFISRRFLCALVSCAFASWSMRAYAWPQGVAGDELAVWQATAAAIATEHADSPLKLWYYQSDFTASTFIASAMSDPDKPDYCGLTVPESKAMITQLKAISVVTIVLDSEIAEAAGFKLGTKKNPRFPYFALSRVVFDEAKDSAWVSVELNGQKGSILRFDKIDGQWLKTARCGGWYMPE
jgi:hypothetical protein